MQDLQLLRRSGDDMIILYQLWMGILSSLWSENNDNKVKRSVGLIFGEHLKVRCAHFNFASGLRLQLHLLLYLHHNQQVTKFTRAQKGLSLFIQKQTSLFEQSGVRKRTDSCWTLLHFFWAFGLNRGECAHKSFVQCFNQLCWGSRRGGRLWLKHQSIFCIL